MASQSRPVAKWKQVMEEVEVTETEGPEQDATAEPEAVPEPPAGTGEEENALGPLGENDLPRAIEAVLFCVGEPVTIRELADIFKFGVHDVRAAVEKLREEYIDSGRAFRIEDISQGVQLLTLPEYDPWLRSLHQKRRSSRLSPAALETLAVVAYKGPITKAELEAIRGVNCAPTLGTLLDRELIRVAGKAPGLGRPLLYHTTPRFLESFGLGSLKDLPQPEAPPAREERESARAREEELESSEAVAGNPGEEAAPGAEPAPGSDAPGTGAGSES